MTRAIAPYEGDEMKKLLLIIVTVLALAVVAPDADAADFNTGLQAFNRNDYKAAENIFTELAKKGDGDAQFFLAMLYKDGRGVKRDRAKAHMFASLAAEQGLDNAVMLRQLIVKRMNKTELTRAMRMARDWVKTYPAAK